MHSNYGDIRDHISDEPSWYDQNGCPRYAPFTPALCPDIYSNVVVLARIACQDCHTEFDVEMHTYFFSFRLGLPPKKWHYGDPPRHGCVGDTMNCDDIAIVEAWRLNFRQSREWQRMSDWEGPSDDPFETGPQNP